MNKITHFKFQMIFHFSTCINIVFLKDNKTLKANKQLFQKNQYDRDSISRSGPCISLRTSKKLLKCYANFSVNLKNFLRPSSLRTTAQEKKIFFFIEA